MHSAIAKSYLEECNINGIRALWRDVFPTLPIPASTYETEIVIHIARTRTKSIGFKYRAYSHNWLVEQNLPSMLPGALRPQAERMYPRVVSAVGISLNTSSPLVKPALTTIRHEMEEAVLECFADGKIDTPHVRKRIIEAKEYITKKLFGVPTHG